MITIHNFHKYYIFFLFFIFFGNPFLMFKANEILWELEEKKDFIKNKKLIWEKYYPDKILEDSRNDFLGDKFKNNSENKNNFVLENDELKNNEFIYLGFAVPNSYVLNKKDFMIYANQLFPYKKSKLEKGTANQNYSVFLGYGISDKITLTGFFSHSDDPLYSKINNVEKQPANKWISSGLGSRLNLFHSKKLLTSLDTSIESWFVKSGGCNGIGCKGNSSNIFDKSLNEFKNSNLIGSIALPSTYKIAKKTNLVFSPKIIFLPEKQDNENNSGTFYGLNSGIGLGFSHKFNDRFHIYNSTYFPLSGDNYFDENLIFKKAIIYDFGFSYLIDPKVSFQSYLTNSFGSTPATGILTIPSDNNLIVGTRLIYKPTSLDFKENSQTIHKYKFEGLSVSNTEIIQPNKVLIDFSFDKDAEIWTNIITGISRNFNFEISTGKSNLKANKDNYYSKTYIGNNLQNLRFGGKAILIKQNEYFPFTSGIRMTFGRALGGTWPGYLFLENINTINLFEKFRINITPKIAWTGSESPISIGSSLIFDINEKYSIILERNNALKNAESNFTSALRISKNSNRFLDFYATNALSFNDIGETINAKETSYGFKIGFYF